MPWTFAHPAAVLPLRRVRALRDWPLDALVVGSLAPDLAYYVDWPAAATLAHTVAGLAQVDLPAGLALLLAWRALREPVAGLLPRRHQAAWRAAGPAPARTGRVAAAARDVAALALGAATHLAWDSFTHAHGWGVRVLPALQASVGHVGDRGLPVFNLLQHASTVVGVVAIGLAYRRALQAGARRADAAHATDAADAPASEAPDATRQADDRRRAARLLALATGAVAVALASTFAGHPSPAGLSAWMARTVSTVVRATDAFAIGLVGAALWQARASRRRPGTRP